MENLRISVHKKIPKNVEVLHLAALATRLMNGQLNLVVQSPILLS